MLVKGAPDIKLAMGFGCLSGKRRAIRSHMSVENYDTGIYRLTVNQDLKHDLKVSP